MNEVHEWGLWFSGKLKVIPKKRKTGLSVGQKGKQDEDFSIIPSVKQVMALLSHGISPYWEKILIPLLKKWWSDIKTCVSTGHEDATEDFGIYEFVSIPGKMESAQVIFMLYIDDKTSVSI